MSTQTLNLEDEWHEIKEEFRNHFKYSNVEIEKQIIRYSRSGEHLEIGKDGSVSAGMPLHENEIQKVKRIQITDSEIKIYSENSEYIFRR